MADDTPTTPPNIYLVGPQCTGKTTLFEALRDHFQDFEKRDPSFRRSEAPVFIGEVAREVMSGKGFTSTDITKPDRGFELQRNILMAQHDAEEELRDHWYISDRAGIDPIVYTQVYLTSALAERLLSLPEWLYLRDRMRRSIVIFCAPGSQAWLSGDDVRLNYEGIDEWMRFGDEFRDVLKKQSIEFTVLQGDLTDLEHRVRFVIDALNAGKSAQSVDVANKVWFRN